MNKLVIGAALCGGLSLGASLAHAQGVPDAGIELRRQDEQRQQLRQRQETAPEVRSAPPPGALPQRLSDQESPCRFVRAVRIEPPQPPWALEALSGPSHDDSPVDRCIGVQGIDLLVNRLNNALITQGAITSRATAQPQSLADGELILHIEAGRVGRILSVDVDPTNAPTTPTAPWAAPTVLATRPGQALNLRDIEQTLENLRRNPGFDADFQITPGDAPGTSDLLIRRQPRERPWRLDLSVDDSGSRSTGQWQGNATLSWDDPLGLSDLLYLSLGRDLAGRDAGPRGSGSTLLHYSLPVGYWLLSATASQHHDHQHIAGAFQGYRYSGQSSQGELQLSRVIHRGPVSKTTVALAAFSRQSSQFIDDTEVQVQRRRTGGWTLEAQHVHHLGNGGWLQGQFQFKRGTGAFGAIAAPEEAFGEGSSRMQVTQGSLQWQTPFQLGQTALQYSGQWRGQWPHTPLSPQDRLCLGGRYTVRGFDGDQNLCGERGQLIRQEVATPWGAYPVQVYAALDAGRVKGPTALPHAQLVGTALGLRWAGPALGGTVQVDTFIGRPLSNPTRLPTARTTAGFSLSASF